MKEAWAVSSTDLVGHFHGSLVGMILDAGLMVQVVLGILLAFSVVSWAIILMKHRHIRRTQKENEEFLYAYIKSGSLSDVLAESKKFTKSSIAEVMCENPSRYGMLTTKFTCRPMRSVPLGGSR